jgi:hypothetical protein
VDDAVTVDASRKHLLAIRPWFFLIIAVVAGVAAVFALRSNNLHMVELRQAVYEADEKGGDTETALRRLREHVYGHMNTNLASGPNAVHPPIQLKHTYERLAQAQQTNASVSNTAIYTEAQKYCEQTIPNGFSGSVRLSCIQAYIKQHAPDSITAVPKNLYQFDFLSPSWSPDLAGWSLVVTAVSLVLAAFLWLYHNALRYLLRRK